MNLADATVSLLMLFECQTVGMDRSRRTEVARQWIARLAAGAGDDFSHFRSGVPWSKPCTVHGHRRKNFTKILRE